MKISEMSLVQECYTGIKIVFEEEVGSLLICQGDDKVAIDETEVKEFLGALIVFVESL